MSDPRPPEAAQQLSREMRLLIECARWPRTPATAEAAAALAAEGVDWDVFLALATRHRIEGLVNHALSESGIEAPAPHRASLAADARENALLELRSAAETARLAGLIEAAGIEVTALKGATVAALAFGRYGVRYSMDIDLLVAPDRVSETSDLLRGLGYVRTEPHEDAGAQEMKARLSRYKDIVFEHPDTGILIELHWRLFQNPRLFRVKLARTREPMPMRSRATVAVLADEIAVLYLCVHGGEHGWARLKWLADVNAILSAGRVTPDALYDQACRHGLSRWVGPGLLLNAALFATPVPARLARDAARDGRMRWLFDTCRANLVGDQRGTELEDDVGGSTRKNLSHYVASDDPLYWILEARYDLLDQSGAEAGGAVSHRLLRRIGALGRRLISARAAPPRE